MRNPFGKVIKKLANIQSLGGTAISFYYFPQAPQNKAHREESIRLKDILREARKRLEAEDKRPALVDMERLASLAEQLAHNGNAPRAVFACSEHGIWEDLELFGQNGETEIFISSRFRLRPLAQASASSEDLLVVLADRINIRFTRYSHGQFTDFGSIESQLPRKARTDGFAGYDAGHKERHVDNWEMFHFKEMAERLKQLCEGDSFDGVLIACRNEVRSEIEPHLHTYVTGKLISYIDADPPMLTENRLREEVEKAMEERRANERSALVREIVGEAQRDARGTLGLRNVMQSLERGEVQTIVIGENFTAGVVECKNCGHLDTRTSPTCALCGGSVQEISDVTDVLVSRALDSNVRVAFIDDDGFSRAGNIGALLRFRADQNTPAKLAS